MGKMTRGSNLYLRLFHGRDEAEQDMGDWGFDGPTFGPLDHIQWTYGEVRMSFASDADAKRFGFDNPCMAMLDIQGDLVLWQGKYYGDWEVFHEQEL